MNDRTGIKLVDKLHASTAFSRTSSADSAIRRRKNWLAEDALHGYGFIDRYSSSGSAEYEV